MADAERKSLPKIDSAGTICWKDVSGSVHRTSGPAVERPSGTREWWQEGVLHRLDGPAVESFDGRIQWWESGVKIV